MDSLHLFAIPKWLPHNIPHELWAIIFHWKWRLEMKNILNALIEKRSKNYISDIPRDCDYKHLLYEVAVEFGYTNDNTYNNWSPNGLYNIWSPSDELNVYTGNYWLKYEIDWWGAHLTRLVIVNNRCGIELLFPNSANISPVGHHFFRTHLKNNLDIDSPEYTTYPEMMKLCMTV